MIRHKKTERAISGHFETLLDNSERMIQKKQARNIKGGKKTKDQTKKKNSTAAKKESDHSLYKLFKEKILQVQIELKRN